MKRLKDLVQGLDTKRVSNEKYYNLIELQECLNSLNDEKIEVEDYILTPYYIFMGKIMELYEYELNIVADTKQSFEEYLLNLTGQQKVSDIPNDIIERQRICRINYEQNTKMLKIIFLKEYIKFFMSNDDVQCQIKECFGVFSIKNMFFYMY